MTDTMIVGLDVGYGQCKAMLETGSSVCFPSLVAPAEFIRFQADVGMPSASGGLTLHDTCEGALFIGELAARQGRPGDRPDHDPPDGCRPGIGAHGKG
jgi:hypothetical protein